MALNMTKHDLEMLATLKKKQKAAKKEQARFRKMILENKEFVIKVLEENEEHVYRENDFAVQREQGGPGVHPGI